MGSLEQAGRVVLRQVGTNDYVSDVGLSMSREQGETPSGVPLAGQWVLRKDGAFLDFDPYRLDLAERNNIYLQGMFE